MIYQGWHHNEIQHYIIKRYVSPGEAVWHNFSFSIEDKPHSADRLPVDIADFQHVFLEKSKEEALVRAERDTKLTGWFSLNQEYIRFWNVLCEVITFSATKR